METCPGGQGNGNPHVTISEDPTPEEIERVKQELIKKFPKVFTTEEKLEPMAGVTHEKVITLCNPGSKMGSERRCRFGRTR